ncbi:1,2-dihydroxy-3-keto-5-methylthiopentene dioxygenase [Rhizoctonia solani]
MGREQGMQGNPMHPQQQHMLGQPHHPQQPQPHHPIQQPPHPQQQFGPQPQQGPPPNGQDMSLATVLHYLQSEWRRYERERNEWEIERAEMRARIALLEGERRSFDNLKIDWTRRIKMLEYALKVERTKQVNQPATAQSNKVASLRKEDDPAPLKEGSGSSSPRSEDIPLPPDARAGVLAGGQPNSRPQSIAGLNGLASQSTANLLGTKMTGRDPKSRARSKEYLKQCLQEVNYLTSPQAVNPLPNRPLVTLGPNSTLISTGAQNMGQQEGQHHQQGSMQQQQPQHHMGQHQPITVALPNLPPFPSMPGMNESNQHGGGNDTIGPNGRPRKLVPEVGKEFSTLNGGLEPSLMPESVGAPRDQPTEIKNKSAPESGGQPPQSQPDVPTSAQEEEPLAPIPLDEPEQTAEQEPQVEEVESAEEAPRQPASSGGATALANMFGERNLVTAIFRPDDRGEWKRQLQEAHDEAVRAGTAGSGLENISLKDEFDTDDMDNAAEESEDKTKVWKTRKTLRNHLDAVRAVAFHPNEMCLASGGDDFTVKIWRLDPASLTSNSRQAQQSVDIEPQLTLRGHTAAITCLVASPRGLLFSASMDASIRIWAFPPESLQPYAPYDPSYSRGELVGHTDVVWGLALVRDGTWLASGGADGMVKVWEITESGGNLRLTWGYNGAEAEAEPEAEPESGETIPVVAVEGIKSDLRKVAVAYANCIVKVFDIENGKELAKLATDETYDGTSATQVNAIASHPTMPLLVTAHEDKYIRIFDVSTGECQHSMLAHLDTVTTLSIDTIGFSLVSGSHDGSIRFWDILGSKTCVQEINAHREKSNEGTLDVVFHPSMPFIASAGADGVVKIYAS